MSLGFLNHNRQVRKTSQETLERLVVLHIIHDPCDFGSFHIKVPSSSTLRLSPRLQLTFPLTRKVTFHTEAIWCRYLSTLLMTSHTVFFSTILVPPEMVSVQVHLRTLRHSKVSTRNKVRHTHIGTPFDRRTVQLPSLSFDYGRAVVVGNGLHFVLFLPMKLFGSHGTTLTTWNTSLPPRKFTQKLFFNSTCLVVT